MRSCRGTAETTADSWPVSGAVACVLITTPR
jgi:hypothetical protein